MLLDSEEIATGVHLVWKLENEGRVRVSLLSVGVQLDDVLGMSNYRVLNMVYGKELARDRFEVGGSDAGLPLAFQISPGGTRNPTR